jgi:hypothetical protein
VRLDDRRAARVRRRITNRGLEIEARARAGRRHELRVVTR